MSEDMLLKFYGTVQWTPHDVKEIRPDWSLDKCDDWLANNAKYIQDALTQAGYQAIEDLMEEDDDERS